MATSFTHHRTMLLTYLKPQAGRVALLAVLLLGSIGLQLIVPQILSRFIDAARAGAAPEALLRLAVVFLMVALTGQVSSAIAVYASATVGWNAARRWETTRQVASRRAKSRSQSACSVSTSRALERSSITSSSGVRTNMRAAALRCT